MQVTTEDLVKSSDFLGNEFEEYKCSRCRKKFRRMAHCNSSYTCPPCSNPVKEEDDE